MATLIFAMMLEKMEVCRATAVALMKNGAKVRLSAALPNKNAFSFYYQQQNAYSCSFFSIENQHTFPLQALFLCSGFGLNQGRRIFAPPKRKTVRSSRG
jgi:hypothetical protein